MADDVTAELERCVMGTRVELNLVEQMSTVRWLPKDRQPTQTEARQQRIDLARRFDDADFPGVGAKPSRYNATQLR